MKAIIKEHLAKATRYGRKVINHTIEGDSITDCQHKVADFIYDRCRAKGYIRVVSFDIEVRGSRKPVLLHSWSYTPTYPEDVAMRDVI